MPRLLKTAAALGVLSALGALALVPYLMVLQPDAFAELPIPLPLALVLQSVQGTLIFTFLAFLGLRAGAGQGLGAPLLQSRLEGDAPLPIPWAGLAKALVLGLVLAFGIAGLDLLFSLEVPEAKQPEAWRGLLASLYGCIAEEVQLRVFLMGVLAWGLGKLGKGRDWPVWVALVLAAVLFGVGHLPAAFELWGPTPEVVVRTILLNALLGVPFGWLYWKRGFAHAAAAHLGGDLALHVVLPLLG
jgi:membrane protease YdiL (CAAX protease family)